MTTVNLLINSIVLQREGILHLRVGREEAADNRVIEAGVHVDDTEAVVMLMAGETAVERKVGAALSAGPVGSAHAVAPRVEMAALRHRPVASDHTVPTAEQVALHIVDAVGIGGGVIDMQCHDSPFCVYVINITPECGIYFMLAVFCDEIEQRYCPFHVQMIIEFFCGGWGYCPTGRTNIFLPTVPAGVWRRRM